MATKHKTEIELYARSVFDISGLSINRGFPHYPSERYGSEISPILLGAAMDRQNASRHRWRWAGGLVEYACSFTTIGLCQGEKISMGPANIEMKELKHWTEIGWWDEPVDQRRLLHDTKMSIWFMRMKLAEADSLISFYGGPNVSSCDRFLLLTLAQNAVAYSHNAMIQRFFDEFGGQWTTGALASKGSVTQMANMLENVHRLYSEYGWALPTGVTYQQLASFWRSTLSHELKKHPDLKGLFERLERIY